MWNNPGSEGNKPENPQIYHGKSTTGEITS